MILRLGDLIDFADAPTKRLRVIWMSPDNTSVATIQVEVDKALPAIVPVQPLLDELEAGTASLMLEDPYRVLVAESGVKASHKVIRDRAWKLIENLVRDAPDIFSPHRRAALVEEVVTKARTNTDGGVRNVTRTTMYRYLRRFWVRGLTPNALLPDYRHSGGKGKTRKASSKKRGRPRKYGTEKGINITEAIRKIFRVAISRCYASDRKRKWTLKDTFGYVIDNFFADKTVDPETGRIVHVPNEMAKKEGGLPTARQFQYWVDKEHIRLEIKRKRMGTKIYDKDLRGLVGTSTAEVRGPGDRYQIDATIADLYLVSRLDRHRIIGRPVLYVVIDVFSRMIVGLYIGLEGPSWVGAMMALANTAADKVAYCKEHGIDIETEDWPCHFLPGAFLGDRGEIESDKIDVLNNNFNCRIENAASYRADWKGIVEQRFRLLPAKFKKYVPGYIETDYRARGGKDYRLDAVLDLEEFTQIILECVLHYNNHHELKKYDKDQDVAAEGVSAVPRELWEWGIRHRSGAMRAYPQDLVQFSLMPRGEATITALGIRFRDNYYTCPRAIEERWFDKARQDGHDDVKVAYDPRNFDAICLPNADGSLGFQTCTLTDRSRANRQLSLWEVDQQAQLDKHRRADRVIPELFADADTGAAIEKIVDGALAKRGEPSQASAASRTKNIREHRAAEIFANREKEAFRPGKPPPAAGAPVANVIPLPTAKRPVQDDYSLPSIEEILGEPSDD